MIFPQILQNNAQLYLKSENSPFSNDFFYFVLWNRALFAIIVTGKCMYLRTCRSFKSANRKKIGYANRKKIGSANRKSEKSHIYGWSANPTNYRSPQIRGFAICRTYLRAAYLCLWLPVPWNRRLWPFGCTGTVFSSFPHRHSQPFSCHTREERLRDREGWRPFCCVGQMGRIQVVGQGLDSGTQFVILPSIHPFIPIHKILLKTYNSPSWNTRSTLSP